MMKYADRVFETSTSQGTGTINLGGAVQSYQTFVQGAGNNGKVPYAIFDDTNWEIGRGTVISGTPDQLQRDVVTSSSNGNSAVNWGPGTRNVILPLSTLFAVWRDENLNYVGDFGTSGGTGNAHTITFAPQRLAYSDGMIVTWSAPADNTGNVTANIDGLGAKSYVNADGTEFPSGLVKGGSVQQAVYTGGKLVKTTLSITGLGTAGSKDTGTTDGKIPIIGPGDTLPVSIIPKPRMLQRVVSNTNGNPTVSAAIPFVDTIPLISDGGEIFSVAFTPKSTTSKLKITLAAYAGGDGSTSVCSVAFFAGSTCIQVTSNYTYSGAVINIGSTFDYAPGSTSPVTISVRMGGNAGTVRLNGTAASRIFGGAAKASFMIEEYEQ